MSDRQGGKEELSFVTFNNQDPLDKTAIQKHHPAYIRSEVRHTLWKQEIASPSSSQKVRVVLETLVVVLGVEGTLMVMVALVVVVYMIAVGIAVMDLVMMEAIWRHCGDFGSYNNLPANFGPLTGGDFKAEPLAPVVQVYLAKPQNQADDAAPQQLSGRRV